MNKKDNGHKNNIVTLQVKLTRAEHNRASRAKGTEQTWSCFIMEHADHLLQTRKVKA